MYSKKKEKISEDQNMRIQLRDIFIKIESLVSFNDITQATCVEEASLERMTSWNITRSQKKDANKEMLTGTIKFRRSPLSNNLEQFLHCMAFTIFFVDAAMKYNFKPLSSKIGSSFTDFEEFMNTSDKQLDMLVYCMTPLIYGGLWETKYVALSER